MTTAIGLTVTTAQESIDTLKSLNCSAETIVSNLAIVVLRATLEAKESGPFETSATLDGRLKVILPNGRIKSPVSCINCKAKIPHPGVYEIQNLKTGVSFSFDEFSLHKMLAHRNFDICAFPPETGRIDLAKAHAVLELT